MLTDEEGGERGPDAGENGKLVHVFGQVKTPEILEDVETGLTVSNCLRLHRTVEIFQWKEQVVDKETGYALTEEEVAQLSAK